MTFEKKFASLKTKFDKADLKKLPDDFAIQLTMTDEDCGGIFYIANKNGAFSVEPYDYKDNSAAVTGTAAAIAKLGTGTVDSSLSINGDATVVEALAGAYKKPAAKKAPAKKPAAKKAPCKTKCATKAAEKPAAKTTAKPAEAAKTIEAAKTVEAAKPAAKKTAVKTADAAKKADKPKA